MRGECVFGRHLFRHLAGEQRLYAARHIDFREFMQLCFGLVGKLAPFPCKIGILGVGLLTRKIHGGLADVA